MVLTFLLSGERSCNCVLSYSVWLLESYGVMLTEIKMALAHRIIAVPCRTSSRFIFKNTSYIGHGKRVFCELCGCICVESYTAAYCDALYY